MNSREITSTAADRFRLPPSHPIMVELVIDRVDWGHFQRLNADNPATLILGNDDPQDGWMVVYIACGSERVRQRMEDGWG